MPAGKSAIVYDHYEYEWEKRLVAFFLFFATMLGVGSFISDVFNYLEFSTYQSGQDLRLIGLDDMITTLFAFIIVAGIMYGLEVIFMLVAFGGRWHRISNGRQAIMWTREVISIVDAILCDLTFLVLYYLSFAVGFCPMLQQMRTLRGKIAVSLTTAHALFAIVQSVYYRKIVGRYPSNCERLLKKFCWMFHVFISACAVFALVAAYIYDPIHTDMTRKQLRHWGFGETHSAPIYFVQDLNVEDVIQKQFNATRVDLNALNDTSAVFDHRLVKVLQCRGLRTAFHFCDLTEIIKSESGGITKRFKCNEVYPLYKYIVADRHRNILNQADCTILANAKYDFQTSLITYAVWYELRLRSNEEDCYGEFLEMDSKIVNDPPHEYKIPLSPSSVNHLTNLLIGDPCSLAGCYGNDTSDVENLFSCMDKNCINYNSSVQETYVRGGPFRIAWDLPSLKYQSDLTSLRSLVQCSVQLEADTTDLHLCHLNNTFVPISSGQKLTERCT